MDFFSELLVLISEPLQFGAENLILPLEALDKGPLALALLCEELDAFVRLLEAGLIKGLSFLVELSEKSQVVIK